MNRSISEYRYRRQFKRRQQVNRRLSDIFDREHNNINVNLTNRISITKSSTITSIFVALTLIVVFSTSPQAHESGRSISGGRARRLAIDQAGASLGADNLFVASTAAPTGGRGSPSKTLITSGPSDISFTNGPLSTGGSIRPSESPSAVLDSDESIVATASNIDPSGEAIANEISEQGLVLEAKPDHLSPGPTTINSTQAPATTKVTVLVPTDIVPDYTSTTVSRQTRASTRRKPPQSATAATTTTSSSTIVPTTSSDPSVGSEEIGSTIASPLDSSVFSDVELTDKANHEKEEVILANERPRRRKLKRRRRPEQQQQSRSAEARVQVSPSPASAYSQSQQQRSQPDVSSTTSMIPSKQQQKYRPALPSSTGAGAQRGQVSPGGLKLVKTVPSTGEKPAAAVSHRNEPLSTNDDVYYEDYYEDETTTMSTPITATTPGSIPRVDPSEIKFLDTDHWNETSTVQKHGDEMHTKKVVSIDYMGGSPKQNEVLYPADEEYLLAMGELNERSNGTLNARSPTGSMVLSDENGKRLSNMISEKSKLSHRLPGAGSQAIRFVHTRPTTTTPIMASTSGSMANRASQTDRDRDVKMVNLTRGMIDENGFMFLGNTTQNLDWSKLVKVVFKSALDNHTIYTVVMNQSDLSDHPIKDWSNELPKLLERDFDKLLWKWSNVFPADHLVIDLGKILINKIRANTTILTTGGNITRVPSMQSDHKVDSSKENLTGFNLSPSRHSLTTTTTVANPILILQPPVDWNHTLTDKTYTATTPTSNLNTATTSLRPLTNISAPTSLANESTSLNQSDNRNKDAYPQVTSSDIGLNTSQHTAPPHRTTSSAESSPEPASKKFKEESLRDQSSYSLSKSNRQTTLEPYSTHSSSTTSTAKQDLVNLVRDARSEHARIEDNVKEQSTSLKHLMIICSVSVVLALSIAVALIMLFFR